MLVIHHTKNSCKARIQFLEEYVEYKCKWKKNYRYIINQFISNVENKYIINIGGNCYKIQDPVVNERVRNMLNNHYRRFLKDKKKKIEDAKLLKNFSQKAIIHDMVELRRQSRSDNDDEDSKNNDYNQNVDNREDNKTKDNKTKASEEISEVEDQSNDKNRDQDVDNDCTKNVDNSEDNNNDNNTKLSEENLDINDYNNHDENNIISDSDEDANNNNTKSKTPQSEMSVDEVSTDKGREKSFRCAILIQTIARGYLLQRAFQKRKKKTVVIQKWLRGCMVGKTYRKTRRKLIVIQSLFRGIIEKQKFLKIRSVIKIQSVARQYTRRQMFEKAKLSVKVIQTKYRIHLKKESSGISFSGRRKLQMMNADENNIISHIDEDANNNNRNIYSASSFASSDYENGEDYHESDRSRGKLEVTNGRFFEMKDLPIGSTISVKDGYMSNSKYRATVLEHITPLKLKI